MLSFVLCHYSNYYFLAIACYEFSSGALNFVGQVLAFFEASGFRSVASSKSRGGRSEEGPKS